MNKRLILDLVTPVAEDVVRQMLLRYGNRILSTVEISDLLIDWAVKKSSWDYFGTVTCHVRATVITR